jgi:hypothetical protein
MGGFGVGIVAQGDDKRYFEDPENGASSFPVEIDLHVHVRVATCPACQRGYVCVIAGTTL